MDKEKIDAFWRRRTQVADPRVATHFRRDDAHLYDLGLIKSYLSPSSDILDLGCGTCALSNALLDSARSIKAVDKFPEFLLHAHQDSRLETVASDLLEFDDSRRYDVVLLFGVMNYFDDSDSRRIYAKCRDLLKDGGSLLVKHACGVQGDVFVDKYSEQVGDHYVATYRHLPREVELLTGGFDVEVVDIYPPALNPWPNTHYYAFVCRKRSVPVTG